MKDIETVVSENIQKLISEYNLSHADLAKIADVSVSTVGKWILKKATPRMGSVQKISDHFGIPKSYILEEDEKEIPAIKEYTYLPATISAGLPLNVDGITQSDQIALPDSVMGKWAGNKDIMMMRINGDSMDKVMPDQSLIAVKPTEIDGLKNGDIVVFSNGHEYSVKRYYRNGSKLIFRPESNNDCHFEQHYEADDNITIHGKVVLYIVELD